MQLRICPSILNWPPQWSRIYGDGEYPKDDTSVLEEVYPSNVMSNQCYLIVRHRKSRYLGTLLFDDESSCKKLLALLSRHCGTLLRELAS